MPNLTLAEIANDWGVSKPYVHKCIKRGCPVDSFENARLWREAYASSKAPTNSQRIARQLGEKEKEASSEPNRRENGNSGAKKNRQPNAPADPFAHALDSTLQAQEEAWRLLQEAMIEGRDSKIMVRLTVHTRAVEARIRAEVQHREELERQRVLIPLSEAKDLFRRGYDIILSRLRRLPQNVAPRCNPANPHLAIAILETECAEIIADARRAYAADTI
jgi:hypothetical protein